MLFTDSSKKRTLLSFKEDEQAIADAIGIVFLNRLKENQENLYLDLNLSTFQRQYFVINHLLIEKKIF